MSFLVTDTWDVLVPAALARDLTTVLVGLEIRVGGDCWPSMLRG